ncbi:MAG: hypothetical protein HY726_00860 [Candidatus Rokubacteria bacterium]|nr:hypothetical protein [Candidatus Rokubacteria bacterium]
MRSAVVLLPIALLGLAGPTWSGEGFRLRSLPAVTRELPWDRLDRRTFLEVKDVVDGAAVVHHVYGIWYRSRKEVFDFLIEHPDFAAEVARILREGKYRVQQTSNGYEADDGRGARGVFKPIMTDGDRRVFHLEGRYDQPLLPTISGRLVLVLETVHRTTPGGPTYAESRVEGFLRLDSVILERLARLALTLSKSLMDRRIRRFFRHVERVSQRAYDDPEGLADELASHVHLPAPRVAQFREALLGDRLPSWAEPLGLRLTHASLTLGLPARP